MLDIHGSNKFLYFQNLALQHPTRHVSHHAVIGDDYTTNSTTLMFGECASKACILLSILDDSIAENANSFNITLERTPNLDPKIFLITVHGVVHIEDDDGMS